MRISDWSSDVCSSDLAEIVFALVVEDVREVERGHPGSKIETVGRSTENLAVLVFADPGADGGASFGISRKCRVPDLHKISIGNRNMLEHVERHAELLSRTFIRKIVDELKIGRASCRERVCHYV